jgi:drug/metabolite transporter (DMT)-like permease
VHATYLGGVFLAIGAGLPAGITALVVGLQPLLTATLAGRLLGEAVLPRQWFGLLLGFGGVGLVVSNKLASAAGSFAFDALWPALAALLGITAGTLYQKKFCPGFDWRTGSVAQFLPSAIVTGAIVFATDAYRVEWARDFILALAWLVLVLSIGAISLLNWLIRHGSAVNVASLFYLTPPTTALLAWLLFGETLAGPALAGMALAVWGVYLARRPA